MGYPITHGRIKPRLAKQPRHLDRVAAMGCLVCGGPAEVHHERTGHRARDDSYVVPLCPLHHRDGAVGFHGLGSASAFRDMHDICLPTVAEWLRDESIAMGIIRNG